MRPLKHVVNISTGKDSTATLLLCRELHAHDSILCVTADTGNEHEHYYAYLDYLESALDIQIVRLRRDMTPEWNHRLAWLRSDEARRTTLRRDAYADDELARIIAVFEKGPTGNPYLDLCMIKGRFPSRKAQFCTQFLKTEPLVEYQMGLIDQGFDVWSWQGVRRDESAARRYIVEFEEVGGGLFNYRPIARWTARDCFDAMATCGIKPNPLYLLGMTRVGCMPCINARKEEILQISKRFPRHIDRIREWELAVAGASRRMEASFFPNPDREEHLDKRGIDNMVRWSKTSRGGRQVMLDAEGPPAACTSSYGLCE